MPDLGPIEPKEPNQKAEEDSHSPYRPGELDDFQNSLTPAQRDFFTRYKRQKKREISLARHARADDPKAKITAAIREALTSITTEDIRALVSSAIGRGNPTAIEKLCHLVGIEIAQAKAETVGATIIINPHPLELEKE